MQGLMMDQPLTISALLTFAEQNHGGSEIVTRTVEGPIHRHTYRDAARRSRQLAAALQRLGVREGDRVGTLAWNTHRHFELYYGVSGMGAVLHTINPRLFPDQIAYIIGHAEDSFLFFDLTFLPLVEQLAPKLGGVRGFVAMTDRAHMPASAIPGLLCYEDLLAAEDGAFAWPKLDENAASSLCYTSGTTGNPKGVVYSHRSTVLHSWAVCMPDAMGLSSTSVILPVVPMFHVNAWGLAYAGPMSGAKLVMPGAGLDGERLCEMLRTEGVTFSAGVPTVWMGMLAYMDAHPEIKLPALKTLLIGGSAMPRAMLEVFETKHGIDALHAWGMTEMSPIGVVGRLLPKHASWPRERRLAQQAKQGRAVFGVEMKIVDDAGTSLPRDGKAFGNLKVRGSWVARSYFRGEGGSILDADGWFDTGDVATIDADGYMQITDRSKDVIKSGGEWISSIDLENVAVGFPGVAEACVIGVPHEKWGERPLLLTVCKPDQTVDTRALLAYFDGKVAKWWRPDEALVVKELPHTATGKLLKAKLREQYRDHRLPDTAAR